MADEYTPTTDEIRMTYGVNSRLGVFHEGNDELEAESVAEFDRWLAEHDEKVRAEVREAFVAETARLEGVITGLVTLGRWQDDALDVLHRDAGKRQGNVT